MKLIEMQIIVRNHDGHDHRQNHSCKLYRLDSTAQRNGLGAGVKRIGYHQEN